jgi:hypothetical protein
LSREAPFALVQLYQGASQAASQRSHMRKNFAL